MSKLEKPSHDSRFFCLAQNLSLRVQSLRKAHGDTMEELANACGVTRGTIHKIEHPSRAEDISLATLFAMTLHFGISLEDLFREIEKHEPFRTSDAAEQNRWFQQDDYLALALLPEHHALQVRANLAEQACLHTTDQSQLETLAKHSAKLRQRRYALVSKK